MSRQQEDETVHSHRQNALDALAMADDNWQDPVRASLSLAEAQVEATLALSAPDRYLTVHEDRP